MISIDARPHELTAAAVKLLAAAEALGLDPSVVRTTSDGLFGLGFIVPEEVAIKAGLKVGKAATAPKEPDSPTEEPAPAAPAKRGPGRPRATKSED